MMRFFLLSVLASLGLACSYQADYSDVKDCAIQCGPAGSCPEGFECANDLCVRPGFDVSQCYAPLDVAVPNGRELFLCRGGRFKLEASGGADSTVWGFSKGEEPLEGVGIEGDELVVAANVALEPGDWVMHLKATDKLAGEEVNAAVRLVVRRCLSTGQSVRADLCEGAPLDVSLMAVGGFGETTWSVVTWSSDDVAADALPAVRIEEGSKLRSGPLVAGSYHASLKVNSVPTATDGGVPNVPFDDSQRSTLDVVVSKCVDVTCEPAGEAVGTRDGLPVFCVGEEQGVRFECTAGSRAGGVDPTAVYSWNWESPSSSSDLQLDPVLSSSGASQILTATGTTENSDEAWDVVVTAATGGTNTKVAVARQALEFYAVQCPVMKQSKLLACVNQRSEFPLSLDKQSQRSAKFELVDSPPKELGPAKIVDDKKLGPLLSVTPKVGGAHDVQLRVTDLGNGGVSLTSLTVDVSDGPCDAPDPPPLPPSEPILLPSACAGQPYAAPLTGIAHADQYGGWKVGNTSVEPWLTIDTSGAEPVLKTRAGMVAPALELTNVFRLKVSFQGTQLAGGTQEFLLPTLGTCKYAFITDSGRTMLGDLRQDEDASLAPKQLSPSEAGYIADGFALSPDGQKLTEFGRNSGVPWLVTHGIAGAALGTQTVHQLGAVVRAVSWAQASDGFVAVVQEPTARRLWAFDWTRASALNDTEMADVVEDAEQSVWPVVWVDNYACAPHRWQGVADTDAMLCVPFSATTGFSSTSTLALRFEAESALRDPRTFYVSTNTTNEQPGRIWVHAVFDNSFTGEPSFSSISSVIGVAAISSDHTTGIPDPTKRWMTQPNANNANGDPVFGIFPFGQGTSSEVAPHWLPNCEEFLVWDLQGKNFVCRVGTELRIATVSNAATPELVDAPIAGTSYVGTSPLSFSADGNWLVFFDGFDGGGMLSLNVSQLGAPKPIPGLKGTAPQVLPFGSIGASMLLHYANTLALLDAATNQVAQLADNLPLRRDCGDVYGGMYQWCGSPVAASFIVPSRLGEGAVFPDADGSLYAVRPNKSMTPWRALEEKVRACDKIRGCAATFQFADYR